MRAGGIGMRFGIGADRDFERMTAAQPIDQFGGTGIALRMRFECLASRRRITAQRNNVADTRFPISISDFGDLVLRGFDASQMRGGRDRRFLCNPRDGIVRALTR